MVLGLAGCSDVTRPYTSGSATDLGGAWGSSGSDVYVTGLRMDTGGWHSLLLHFDGRRWSTSLPGTTAYLTSMWGDSTDQFVVGFIPFEGGRILHRRNDGGRWSTEATEAAVELFGVWGSSPTDVFAVGDTRLGSGGAILHYDGVSWSAQVDTVAVRAVWGSSASDVFAVGTDILHYDGRAWSMQVAGAGRYFFGVWGSSAGDAYAVGGNGLILHYGGGRWVTQASGTTSILDGVWGTSASDVFAVGYGGTILHFDGSGWRSQPSGTTRDLQGVWGSSGRDVYAAGYEGTLLHYDGSNWSTVRLQSPFGPPGRPWSAGPTRSGSTPGR